MKARIRTPTPDEHLVVYSDGKDSYQTVFPQYFEKTLMDYGKLIKIREKGRVVDKIREVVFGQPFINCVHTNNVENHNGILRGHVSYLVRRTKCIAKKIRSLENALHFFQFYWNFIHTFANKTTPAIIEGRSNKIWTWGDFLHYKIKLH